MGIACGDSTSSNPPQVSVGASTALSQTEACDELAKLKQASGRDVVHGDDELLEKYRVLLSECSGLDPSAHEKLVDAALKADTPRANVGCGRGVQYHHELRIERRERERDPRHLVSSGNEPHWRNGCV
jgi:hypothetical protein